MNETEKLENAAALIAEMTCGQQMMTTGIGGAYIRTSEDANFALQMRLRPHFEQERYQITFEVYSRRMGTAMDSNAFLKLLAEGGRLHAVIAALEIQNLQPSHEEYQAFLNDLEQEQEIAPTMEQTF